MTSQGRRRFFGDCLTLVGLGLLSGCSISTARPAPMPALRIGWLRQAEAPPAYLEAFRDELRALGYVEGESLIIEVRAADAVEQLPSLADQLVGLRPAVIVTQGSPATRAAREATSSIPIVFNLVSDPVGSGFVASLARPGGNLTGLANLSAALGPKRLELLRGVFPSVSRVAVLWNAANPAFAEQVRAIEMAARSYGMTVQDFPIRELADLEGAVDLGMARGHEVFVDFTAPFSARAAQLLLARRVPAIFQTAEQVQAGGLLSYGPNLPASFRRAAGYVDKILKGANPADLPVEQPTTFDLVVNLKTAQALGLTIPPSVLQQATEVIQ